MNPITEYIDAGNAIYPISETPQALGVSQYQQYKQPENLQSTSAENMRYNFDPNMLENKSIPELLKTLYSALKKYDKYPVFSKIVLKHIFYIFKKHFDSDFGKFLKIFTYKTNEKNDISIKYIVDNIEYFFGDYTYVKISELIYRLDHVIKKNDSFNPKLINVRKFFVFKIKPFVKKKPIYKDFDEPTYFYRNQPYDINDQGQEGEQEQKAYEKEEKKKGYQKIKKISKPAGPPKDLLKEKPKKKPKKKRQKKNLNKINDTV